MYKVDSLNKKLKYSESRIKSLETRYDSLFCITTELKKENDNLKDITKNIENYVLKVMLFLIGLVLIIKYFKK
jgi:hypothetical protein